MKPSLDSFLASNKGGFSYRELETFVLSLLEVKLKKDKKKMHKYVREEIILPDGKIFFLELDAVAIDGICDLTGPTIIEFKRMFSKSTIEFISKSTSFYPKYKSVLIIIGSHLSLTEREYFEDFIREYPKDLQLVIWDVSDIIKLANDYSEEANKIIQNLGNEILQSTAISAQKVKDWKEEIHCLITYVDVLRMMK